MSEAVVNLPKDVGLCVQCNARNSKHASRCHSCTAMLPWAQAKAAPKKQAGPAPSGPPQGTLPEPKMSAAGVLDSVDWGATLTAGVLAIGAFLISMIPFIGFRLFRYLNAEDNWLKYPCGAGLALGLVGIFGGIFLR